LNSECFLLHFVNCTAPSLLRASGRPLAAIACSVSDLKQKKGKGLEALPFTVTRFPEESRATKKIFRVDFERIAVVRLLFREHENPSSNNGDELSVRNLAVLARFLHPRARSRIRKICPLMRTYAYVVRVGGRVVWPRLGSRGQRCKATFSVEICAGREVFLPTWLSVKPRRGRTGASSYVCTRRCKNARCCGDAAQSGCTADGPGAAGLANARAQRSSKMLCAILAT